MIIRWLIVTLLILIGGVAEARMKAGPVVMSTHVRERVAAGGTVLDNVTPTAAYGLRKLRAAYVGQAIRLRRASDNAQQDIGFVGSDFDTVAATTFCNATTCFVAKWYDQSGNVRDMAQATGALQPAFSFSCLGSLPCVSFTPGSLSMTAPSVSQTGIVSFSVVLNRATGTGICVLPGISLNSIKTRSGTAGLSLNGTGSITTTSADAAWHAANGVINGASSYFAVDGATTAGAITGSATSASPTLTGIASTTCNLAELAIWGNYPLTAAEADALNTNQHTYWGF